MNTLYLPDFQDPPPDIYPSISSGPYPTFRSAISDMSFFKCLCLADALNLKSNVVISANN